MAVPFWCVGRLLAVDVADVVVVGVVRPADSPAAVRHDEPVERVDREADQEDREQERGGDHHDTPYFRSSSIE